MVILNILALLLRLLTLTNGIRTAKTDGLAYLGTLDELFSDEGELAEVRYLTKEGGDYHIIELKIPSLAIPITIHLIRTESVSPCLRVNDGEESETEIDLENCFYFGQIVEFPGGTSALSDCGDQKGFNGHILVGDEHFVIEPAWITTINYSVKTEGKGRILLHKVFRAHKILERENASHSDMARVPRDELQKAIAESEESEKSEESEESQEDLEDSLLETFDFLDELEIISETFRGGSKSKIKNKKKKKRKKMLVEGEKVVEIAVFTDAELFTVWERRFSKEAKSKLKLFILNLVNNMNLLYSQPSLGVEVSFRLVYLEMLKTVPSEMESIKWLGEATKYLKSFCKYAGNKNTNAERWDHAVLLTGHDLAEGGDPLIAGMAWFTTMCLKYWSCSVSEGTSFGSTFILTHEIGHSLGMEHDGLGSSKKCNDDKFIMSPTTGSGKNTWSSCSTKNLKDFITKGTSELDKEEPASIPLCITKASPLKSKRIQFSKSKLPGQIYGPKLQCQYDCGTDCTPYSNDANVCSMLMCQKLLTVIEAHPALEGTTCGTGKKYPLKNPVEINPDEKKNTAYIFLYNSNGKFKRFLISMQC